MSTKTQRGNMLNPMSMTRIRALFKRPLQPVRNSRGMTLIEIMIVLLIIGGLLAFLGGNVFSSFRKAKVRQARIQMSEIGKALETFATDCGSYPSQDVGLKALLEQTPECKNWGPEPYAKKGLLKDPWGGDFIYEVKGSSYVIKSYGQDKKEGGTGNDADLSSEDQ